MRRNLAEVLLRAEGRGGISAGQGAPRSSPPGDGAPALILLNLIRHRAAPPRLFLFRNMTLK
jgi:hypothetical protein